MKKLLALAILAVSFFSSASKAVGFEHDHRPLAMRTILEQYNSPMVGYELELIGLADQYGLDWTLLAAIAGTESGFGKRMPHQCLNPYGWGIYGNNKICFKSFPEAAEAVARGLATRYNTSSLESIGRTYNKVSTASWIGHTRFFMNKIKNVSIPVADLPIEL